MARAARGRTRGAPAARNRTGHGRPAGVRASRLRHAKKPFASGARSGRAHRCAFSRQRHCDGARVFEPVVPLPGDRTLARARASRGTARAQFVLPAIPAAGCTNPNARTMACAPGSRATHGAGHASSQYQRADRRLSRLGRTGDRAAVRERRAVGRGYHRDRLIDACSRVPDSRSPDGVRRAIQATVSSSVVTISGEPSSVRCTGQRSAISSRRRRCSSLRSPESFTVRVMRSILAAFPSQFEQSSA